MPRGTVRQDGEAKPDHFLPGDSDARGRLPALDLAYRGPTPFSHCFGAVRNHPSSVRDHLKSMIMRSNQVHAQAWWLREVHDQVPTTLIEEQSDKRR